MARNSRTLINNFTGGELSPLVDARMDLDKFFTGCRTLQNCLIFPQGGAFKRPGTQYVAEVPDSANITRLIPFIYRDDDAYAIEFSDLLIRFYRTVAGVPGLIEDGADNPYSIVSPYVSADLALLKHRQFGDVMYLTHPDYKPRRLVRTSHDNWAISEVVFERGPFLKENDTNTTLSVRAYTIDTVTSGAGGTFVISNDGDLSDIFAVGNRFPIHGSDDNDGTWTVANIAYSAPDFTITVAATETVTADAGPSGKIWPDLSVNKTVDLVASDTIFDTLHVGALWQLTYNKDADVVYDKLDNVETSEDAITPGYVELAYGQTLTATTTGTWTAIIALEKSVDGGTTWKTVKQVTSVNDNNMEITKEEDETNGARYRLNMIERTSGIAKFNLVAEQYNVKGAMEINTVISSTIVRVEIKSEVAKADEATTTWAEGAWSDYRGWPTTLDFFEQRLFFSDTIYEPLGLWGSKSFPGGDFHNFAAGDLADNALSFTLSEAQQDPIKWLVHNKRLIAGTSGGPFTLGATNVSEPLTPTNVIHPERVSNQGSAAIDPVMTAIGHLFVEKGGKRIYELTYNWEADGLVTEDMTRLATHITAGGITEIAMQRRPEPIMWGRTGNGKLACLTYLRKENIVGWSDVTTNGTFESVIVIPGDDGDDVWVIANRTINGATVRYVEKFKPWSSVDGSGDPEDAFLVDCGLTYSGISTNSIGGLTHLIGETVSILAQGGNHADKVVSALGVVTLDNDLEVTDAQIGLGYTAIVKPMKIPEGSLLSASLKRVEKFAPVFYNTGYVEYGSDNSGTSTDDMQAIVFREGDEEADVPALFTGAIERDWPGGFEEEGNVIIQSDRPLPMCVLSMTMLVEAA